jgi:hypothetical protein
VPDLYYREERRGKPPLRIFIKEKQIFQEPEPKDEPRIYWIWDKRLEPASTRLGNEIPTVMMNLYSLRYIRDCAESITGAGIYLSAVLVEELSHCATSSLWNHRNWIRWLDQMQEELHGRKRR